MILPYLQYEMPQTKMQTLEFKGYNANPVIGDGEMAACKNLTSDNYPVLTPRPPRKKVKEGLTSPTAMYVRQGKICYVDGTGFYYDNAQKGVVTAGAKQFVSMGDRIIIWPDKCIYDISDDKFDTLEKTYSATGLVFTANTITTAGANPVFPFKAGDGIKVTGCTVKAVNNSTFVIKSVADRVLTFADNTLTAATETASVTIAREVPDMEYICEYSNRLWGVKGNTIYASALGKPENFNVFQSNAADSYSVDVGSSGPFTGCQGFNDHVALFKEQCIHRLYGGKPSNYQFVDSQSQGVQSGCSKSVVNVLDNLIYKSPSGVMAYSGSTPENLSSSFGTRKFSEAVGGTDGRKYYVSLKEGTAWELFAYDFKFGAWLKEDDSQAIDFSYDGGKLYMLSNDKNIYQLNSDDETDEIVEWMAEFGEMSENADEKKIHNRFTLQVELMQAKSSILVEINQNRKGWKEIYRADFKDRKTVSIPIVPTRCDYLNLRVSGKGQAKVYSLSRAVQIGSDE